MCDDATRGQVGRETRVTELRPEERALFETEATALYEEVVASGGLAADDPRIADGRRQRAAFDLLVELGPARPRPRQRRPDVAGRPRHGPVPGRRPAGPAGRRAAHRVLGSGPAPSARSPRPGGARRSRAARPVHRDPRTDAIGTFLAGARRRREEELLTAQPQTGRDARQPALAAARARHRRCSSAASRCARSTSTAPGAARSPTSTSPRSPPAAPRCAPSTSSSTG